VKITEDSNDIAEFAYDALGRRIEKKDLIDANKTRRYYYNNNWQVLCEYDANDVYKRCFVYGNYIDEVLFTQRLLASSQKYYVHDRLYSPAALITYADGIQNELRCRFTANVIGKRVIAGPIEATASGNILMQARATGQIKSLSEASEIVRNSFELKEYQPKEAPLWEERYGKLEDTPKFLGTDA